MEEKEVYYKLVLLNNCAPSAQVSCLPAGRWEAVGSKLHTCFPPFYW